MSLGRLVPNHEKVNVIRRVLLALDAMGVSRVVIMPDASALSSQALEEAPLSWWMQRGFAPCASA